MKLLVRSVVRAGCSNRLCNLLQASALFFGLAEQALVRSPKSDCLCSVVLVSGSIFVQGIDSFFSCFCKSELNPVHAVESFQR